MSDKKTVKNVLGELAGYASLCWSETPKGVFDSTQTSKAVDQAEREIKELTRSHRKPISEDELADVIKEYTKFRYQMPIENYCKETSKAILKRCDCYEKKETNKKE